MSHNGNYVVTHIACSLLRGHQWERTEPSECSRSAERENGCTRAVVPMYDGALLLSH